MKKLALITFFLLSAVLAFATHNRSGEITFRQKSPGSRTYIVKVLTYTKTSSPADRDTLTVFWGDNTKTSVNRSSAVILQGDIKRNEYEAEHTYNAAGNFKVHIEDKNRDANVINIPNSVEVPFYIETQIQINPFLGYNNSPVLLQAPIDKGYKLKKFLHNPNAYDPDGDSLSYRLVSCRGQDGDSIPGFFRPKASKSFTLNARTGDLIWDAPLQPGEYNVAFLIEEWRRGKRIGYVTRDLQIEIGELDGGNNAPQLVLPADLCVEAGDTVRFKVTATDKDNDFIALYATGSPFELHKPYIAQFDSGKTGKGTVSGDFYWKTVCEHISKKPYQLVFKAIDDNNAGPLFDLQTMHIMVVPPSPKNPQAVAQNGAIKLTWDKEVCAQGLSYKIYRRNGKYNFTPSECELGVPGYTGYTLIDSVSGINNTTYLDDNKGAGLVAGAEYCYMIVALFPGVLDSYASVEVCADLKKDVPVMTQATVVSTNTSSGVIQVRWSKPNPLDLDTIQNPGPYKFELYRSEGSVMSSPVLIKTFPLSSFNALKDTLYTDSGLNTLDNQYAYQVKFYNTNVTPGDRQLGKVASASSIFLSIIPSYRKLKLSWNANTPWSNNMYIIHRWDGNLGTYEIIDTAYANNYVDYNLVNGQFYRYYVKSVGSLGKNKGFPPIVNNSQEVIAAPKDDIAPCPPKLSIVPDCDRLENNLAWEYQAKDSCADDVRNFVIYFKNKKSGTFDSIATTSAYDFIHSGLNTSIAGCYAIAAVDSNDNKGARSNTVCVDNCPIYKLPNVFTPNGDGINDKFVPYPYRFIQDVNFKLFNRWGLLLFETTDPDINWDGYTKNGGQCPDGVYFYICEVNEIHIDEITTRAIKGFVELLRERPTAQPK